MKAPTGMKGASTKPEASAAHALAAEGVDTKAAQSGDASECVGPSSEVDVEVDSADVCNPEVNPEVVGPIEARAQAVVSVKLLSILCLVGGIEGADYVLLPGVFYALQRDLGLSLIDVSTMALVQALAGNFAAPVWGILADRGTLRRKTLIVFGCIWQGVITIALAGVDTMAPMVILRALNGFLLASLRPIANGIVADVTTEGNRGKVYGAMGIAMNIGTMAGTFIGVNLSRKTVIGMQGWRVAFLVIGGLSVLIGGLAGVLMREPPRAAGAASGVGRGWGAVKVEARELFSYFRLPSFCVLILQGCFGSVPWTALGYKTLFFQLAGINDFQVSLIEVFSQIAGSFGAFLGGVVGDGLSRCSKNHGRPFAAQISVMAGMPVAWFVFMVTPPEAYAFVYYLGLMVVLGLFATWCGVGVNLPILSEIVQDDRRATIMAWEGTLEGTCGLISGNALVGLLAEKVFGYDMSNARAEHLDSNQENAKALGRALVAIALAPWILCFACYSLLHCSYPRDLRRLRLARERAAAAAKEECAAAGSDCTPKVEAKNVSALSE